MSRSIATLMLLVLLPLVPTLTTTTLVSGAQHEPSLWSIQGRDSPEAAIRAALQGLTRARAWVAEATAAISLHSNNAIADRGQKHQALALDDCSWMYQDSEHRLQRLAGREHNLDDSRMWLSGALTCHHTCLDGLRQSKASVPNEAGNLTYVLRTALALYSLQSISNANSLQSVDSARGEPLINPAEDRGLLASWDALSARADVVVAKDGSGQYKTIKEAVAALAQMRRSRPQRIVVHVKSGVYAENVAIDRDITNVMFVGDGIDKTIVTGNRNVIDGSTTIASATFGVSGDGFWARDMAFENTAGAVKEQALALRVAADQAIFYRCSFRGYQDTLLVHSQRQFFRDCHIYGTVDFIFGNAAAVLQNCDIFVRRPLHATNMVTAQGREDPNEPTGISIHGCRIIPTAELRAVKESVRTYLGRPWKKYSRTVIMKTDLDGLVDPKGWTAWNGGDFALSTLYYGEYMNMGAGADTSRRVNWPGFHVLKDAREADPFTVRKFIQGDAWIPHTGIPFSIDP